MAKYVWNANIIDVTIDELFAKEAKAKAQADVMKEKDIDLSDILADPSLGAEINAEVDSRVLAAAISDPEKSAIVSADPALAKTIEDMKDLVDTAKGINGEFGSDIRIGAKAPGKYTVNFRGELYAYDLSVKGVEKALGRLKNILIHHPYVVVEVFKQDPTATPLKATLDLQTFIACKMNRFLGIVTLTTCEGPIQAVAYTPKRPTAPAYCGDDSIVDYVDNRDEW